MLEKRKVRMLPQWGGVFEIWSINFVNKNFWRVAHVYGSKEDSLQECALVFARCRARYTGPASDARFMALYKISVINEFNSCAIRDGHRRSLQCVSMTADDPDSEGDIFDIQANDLASTNWAGLISSLRASKDELLLVLDAIANAPLEALDILFKAPTIERSRTKIRRQTNIDDEFLIDIIRAFVEERAASKTPSDYRTTIDDLTSLLAA